MRIFVSLIVTILIAVVSTSTAQTLQEQFSTLKEDAETFKVYKVIKQTELNDFWASVTDSVNSSKRLISEEKQNVAQSDKQIVDLNTEISVHKEEVAGLQHDASHIEVLGIDFYKEGYIITNFTIIALLIAALSMLYYKFQHDNKAAKSTISAHQKLEEDFEDYKKKSLEKQMKLRRELQTERNRIDEIRSA